MAINLKEIIHGLSDVLRVQDKLREHADGLTELYEEMARNIKSQGLQIEKNNDLYIEKHHHLEMRIVKLETTIETLFAVSGSGRRDEGKSPTQSKNMFLKKGEE